MKDGTLGLVWALQMLPLETSPCILSDPWLWITHKGMAILRRFILQKESATGQKMNVLNHPHEIAVCPQSVRQGEQSCWIVLPVALAGAVQVVGVERAPGAQSRWCSELHRLGWGSGSFCKGQCCGWLALQSFFDSNGFWKYLQSFLFYLYSWQIALLQRKQLKSTWEVRGREAQGRGDSSGCCWSGALRNCLGGNKWVP